MGQLEPALRAASVRVETQIYELSTDKLLDRARRSPPVATNYIIYALGMKGAVIDKVFVPYRESDGTLPIFSEDLQAANRSDKIQKAENKVSGVTEF